VEDGAADEVRGRGRAGDPGGCKCGGSAHLDIVRSRLR
jgi:hypothetical protein